jgi:hypothetical protein
MQLMMEFEVEIEAQKIIVRVAIRSTRTLRGVAHRLFLHRKQRRRRN